jgi:hypothetical protein
MNQRIRKFKFTTEPLERIGADVTVELCVFSELMTTDEVRGELYVNGLALLGRMELVAFAIAHPKVVMQQNVASLRDWIVTTSCARHVLVLFAEEGGICLDVRSMDDEWKPPFGVLAQRLAS